MSAETINNHESFSWRANHFSDSPPVYRPATPRALFHVYSQAIHSLGNSILDAANSKAFANLLNGREVVENVLDGVSSLFYSAIDFISASKTGVNAKSFIARFAAKAPKIVSYLVRIRVLSIVGVPISLYALYKNVKIYIAAWKNHDKATMREAALNSATNLGSTVDAFASFFYGVAAWCVHTSHAFNWVPFLNIVGSAFGVIGAAANVVNLIQLGKLRKQIDALINSKDQNKIQAFENLLKLLDQQRDNYLERHFINDASELKEKLQVIQHMIAQINEKEGVQAAEKKVDEAFAALKKRTAFVRNGHILSISIVATNVVGVILMFTPASAVGFALFTVASIMLGYQLYRDIRYDDKLSKDLTALLNCHQSPFSQTAQATAEA